ncbi:class I SAM-dependent methyltransferase [Phycicoccus endophyticus]|uniref:Class I SAM-dependent methyltransferase n=1 Tax=Phycicoccus endophyticus TaxID=1690220 RepID=A0A7G9R1R3_9MICO|nr:cyclopropane-fatty-acyl-phospholipid synthase family protein [Phycicoccus endophyticus]NHI18669.1 class I SAM-dependent methyltransferase [Phycicoccus endophyticus]QNN49538.1 class I SAM-dependent methyltransferase [Phycicoccus endophyticus]GGL37385.1 cyclopropane-fatty-acyl-phospholipid synthase [Phycicoccus endophyticus]
MTTTTTPPGVAGRIEAALRPLLGGPLPVRLRAWDGSEAGPDAGPDPGAPGGVPERPLVELRSPRALTRLLWHPGELGAAQAYVTGELEVHGDLGTALDTVRAAVAERGIPPLTATRVVRLLPDLVRLARDAGALGRPPAPPATQAVVSGRLHSLARDRASVSHHYDLSNAFYELLLDPNLAYSAAFFADGPQMPLEDAQAAKLDLVCRKLGLSDGMRLLDVGCGWGALSLHAAEHFGARVTGVTISAEQQAFVQERVHRRGLEGRVEVRLQDYREVRDEPFDAVASLEMGEHVGERNYGTYAAMLHRSVRPGGYVLVQQMSRRGAHPGGGPFIEAFIAPDMTMRPVGETLGLLEGAGLEVRGVHALREHYVWTVDAWHRTLEERWAQVVGLIGEEGARVWRLYLVGGSQAFRDHRMGVDQLLLRRPGGEPAVTDPAR